MSDRVTSSYRLILPADANHYGTLYAGALLRYGLEASYAAACRMVGERANLVLRRVLSLECYKPVPVGSLVEIRCLPLHITRVYQVVGFLGTLNHNGADLWMDGLMGFVQVGPDGQVAEFPDELTIEPVPPEWNALRRRLEKLLRVRAKLTDE